MEVKVEFLGIDFFICLDLEKNHTVKKNTVIGAMCIAFDACLWALLLQMITSTIDPGSHV